MANLSEYHSQFYVKVCCGTFNANDYLTGLANNIKAAMADLKIDGLSLRLSAKGKDGDFCNVDCLSMNDNVTLARAMSAPDRDDLPVELNARAACLPQVLERIIDEAVANTDREFQLSAAAFSQKCFSLTK